MTDTSLPLVKPVNGPDHLIHASLPGPFHTFHHQRYPPPVVDGVHEDDGQIHCVCGYPDDDGSTVACDMCNRWQHIVCYYPDHEHSGLPDDLAHFCVDCRPQRIDVEKARIKQRARREHTEYLTNGNKRNPSKSHKKKTKESSVPYTNGWPLDKSRLDRNSASPRDQAPPAKRPKTSHRTSDSTTTTTNSKGHSRKRNLSNVHHTRSASHSPDAPNSLYTDEFLQCYHDDDWKPTHINLFNNINISNSLSTWLNATEEAFKEEHGIDKTDVLMRWDGQLDDIPGRADIEIRTDQDDRVMYEGRHPTWKYVTVREPIANGAYIGEIKGHVGSKEEYQADVSNRWAHLRHPEPFVFFHPKLPVVVDARHEGTQLRYVRRSCNPNAKLQILVTDGVNYHFCLMAVQQIEPGVEIAVGWDTTDGLPELAQLQNMPSGSMSLRPKEKDLLMGWVSTALANCGPCACQLPESECKMLHFDRRPRDHWEGPLPLKAPKSKKRKGGQHISPLNTHGVNSRSGSEARKVDPDDEPTDSRSASGSAGRESASRDITPNTHYSTNGSLSTMPELSERERKKLAKEEEMFRRQEEERANKEVKKKRNSGGSNMNTPNSTSSKQFGFPTTTSRYVDAGTHSRQPGSLTSKTATVKRSKSQKGTPKPIPKVERRSKPVDASTQCDLDQEDADARAAATLPRKPFLSHRQRLLQRAAHNNLLFKSSLPLVTATPSRAASIDDTMEMDRTDAPRVPPEPPSTTVPDFERSPVASSPIEEDTEMPDVVLEEKPRQSSSSESDMKGVDKEGAEQGDHSPTVEQSVPLLHPKVAANDQATEMPKLLHHRVIGMQLQMPPPPANPFAGPQPPLSAGTPTSTFAQSPASLTGPPSIFSPAVTAAVTPSPARKKLSLSDWTRRKAKGKDDETTTDRESSPASTASGPVVPPLQPSSSSEAIAAESGSAIEDDIKMEDVVDKP